MEMKVKIKDKKAYEDGNGRNTSLGVFGISKISDEGLHLKSSHSHKVILPVDRSAGECLVKGSTCAPLLTSVPPLDLSQEPAKKRHGSAAADRTPTLKSVTVSPNTKNWNRANSLSQTTLSLASVKCMN